VPPSGKLDRPWRQAPGHQGTSRGRRIAGAATEAQLDRVRDEFLAANPEWRHVAGGRDAWSGNRLAEEYLPNPATGRRGSAWPDLMSEGPDGTRVRINTVHTDQFGQLTQRDLDNINRVFELTHGEPVIAIPKYPRFR
jgi:hypothetical protein